MRHLLLALAGLFWLTACSAHGPEETETEAPVSVEQDMHEDAMREAQARAEAEARAAAEQLDREQSQQKESTSLKKTMRAAAEKALREALPAELPMPQSSNSYVETETSPVDPMARALSEMKTYPIAYETPTDAKMGEAFEVTLAIDATGDDSAVEALPGEHVIVEGEAKLSNTVEATLSGAAFDIRLMNKARQRLSPFQESTWRWAVTPQQSGQHTLYLEIHAVLGDDESVLLESFADQISVVVSQKKSGILGIPAEELRTWIGIIGGSFSAILGLVALVSLVRNRKTNAKGGDGAGDNPDLPE